MNYKKIYEHLIDKAKKRNVDGYVEVHHIIPRCVGGGNSTENLVRLTAREHFIAHLLLAKIYNGNLKLIKAVAMMCVGQEERKLTNRLYGKYRELFRMAMSESQTGVKNSQYGTRWVHNNVEKKSRKIPKTEPLPLGWCEGRKIVFKTEETKKVSRREIQKRLAVEKYSKWYIIYNEVGFEKFCSLTDYNKSQPNLVRCFAKHVKEFVPQNGKKRGK
jgi:hypothetical protein